MRTICEFFVRHSASVLAVTIFIGLLAPPLASALRPAITPIIAALVFLAMLRIPLASVSRDRLPVVAWVAIWLLILNPLLAALLTGLLMIPETQRVPIVLICCVPPILSAPALALLLRLDAALTLGIVTVVSLLCPVTLAVVPALLLELPADLDALSLFVRFALLIGGAFVAASVLRRALGAARVQSRAPEIDALGLLLLVLFAIGIMDGVTQTLLREPWHVLGVVASVFAINLGLQGVGALLFAPYGRRVAVTVGFASGNRNTALWVAALPLSGASEVMLYIAAAQLPIYLLPSVLAPVYARLVPPPPGE